MLAKNGLDLLPVVQAVDHEMVDVWGDGLVQAFRVHGEHGGDEDPGMETGGMECGQGLEAGRNRRGLGLQNMSNAIVIGGDRKTHRNFRHLFKNIQITSYQGRAGENICAPAVFLQDFQAAPGQAVAGFHGLVGIADAGQQNPAGLFFAAQFVLQDVQEIHLDFHETAPGCGRVMAAVAAHEDGVAITAAMGAAQVGIDDIIHPGNLGADQGGFNFYFSDIHQCDTAVSIVSLIITVINALLNLEPDKGGEPRTFSSFLKNMLYVGPLLKGATLVVWCGVLGLAAYGALTHIQASRLVTIKGMVLTAQGTLAENARVTLVLEAGRELTEIAKDGKFRFEKVDTSQEPTGRVLLKARWQDTSGERAVDLGKGRPGEVTVTLSPGQPPFREVYLTLNEMALDQFLWEGELPVEWERNLAGKPYIIPNSQFNTLKSLLQKFSVPFCR